MNFPPITAVAWQWNSNLGDQQISSRHVLRRHILRVGNNRSKYEVNSDYKYTWLAFMKNAIMRISTVLSKTWPAGQNRPFGVFCWALLRKIFCNGYWPFDGPMIIEMQEFTSVDWIGETVRLYRHSKITKMSLSYVHQWYSTFFCQVSFLCHSKGSKCQLNIFEDSYIDYRSVNFLD